MYQRMIIKLLGCTPTDARLVEGFMRLECGTLDNLSPDKFKHEALMGYTCMTVDRPEAEALAQSFGL